MKKVLMVLPVLALLAISSCGKSYTCHCVYSTDGQVDHEDNSKINEGKKDKSQAACENMSSSTSSTVNGYTTVSTTTCTLQD